MWVITGPFDGGLGDVVSTKTKLLKTGRRYPLGRKERQLLVNNKKISRDHCEFTVGSYKQGDMVDPSSVPRLDMHNTKEKPISIDREGEAVIVNPGSSCELLSGDKVNIVAGISVEVNWRRVACFLPPGRGVASISAEDCASIGVSLLTSPDPLATHHLTAKYELTVPLTTSLLSATQLVKTEWLQELIRLGCVPEESNQFKLTALERLFIPPLESKYRPIFSPTLPASLKSFKFWEPSEERLNFLKRYRFILLGDKEGEIDPEVRELVTRGGGEYEGFPMKAGQVKWRQLLAKGKRKVEAGLHVFIVYQERVVQANVGLDQWQEMVADAQSLSLPTITVDSILNAVVNVDISIIDHTPTPPSSLARSQSPLPDFIPNTHPDEPSLPIEPEKVPDSAGLSASPKDSNNAVVKPRSSSPQIQIPGLEIPPPPRKTLVRRVKPVSTTSDHEASVSPAVVSHAQEENLGFTIPPAPRSTRLKRRAATPVSTSATQDFSDIEPNQEPPLKKFKALFDASDPDKAGHEDPSSIAAAYDVVMGDSDPVGFAQDDESTTQTGTRPLRSQTARRPRSRRLDIVAEEEEENTSPSQADRAPSVLPNVEGSESNRQFSRPAPEDHPEQSETEERTQTKPKATRHGVVDTDQAFLTALASKKKGKRTEDDFDREFNNLRISKPDLRRQEEERAWEVLEDFGNDVRNIRGNFMVILETDIYKDSHHRHSTTHMSTYDGRPNFKKFKKNKSLSPRAPVELVAKTESDYGVGSGYWKDSTTAKDYTTLQPSRSATQNSQKCSAPTVLESDDETMDEPVVKVTRRPAPKGSQSKTRSAPKRLFLESDGEHSQEPSGKRLIDDDIETALPTRRSKRRHIVADDDSDDGVAFKGFGKKRRVR
ncbi:hypothetical protein F5I97DRAFT_2058933 [Phlebopus sp. FC_14]|nr:hypothetical protein F5I97DRAFT_2058933 [Phlebopus sp. FC_14]